MASRIHVSRFPTPGTHSETGTRKKKKCLSTNLLQGLLSHPPGCKFALCTDCLVATKFTLLQFYSVLLLLLQGFGPPPILTILLSCMVTDFIFNFSISPRTLFLVYQCHPAGVSVEERRQNIRALFCLLVSFPPSPLTPYASSLYAQLSSR